MEWNTKAELLTSLRDVYEEMPWQAYTDLTPENEALLKEASVMLYLQLELQDEEQRPTVLTSSTTLSDTQLFYYQASLSYSQKREIGYAFHKLVEFIYNQGRHMEYAFTWEEKSSIKMMVLSIINMKTFQEEKQDVEQVYSPEHFDTVGLATYLTTYDTHLAHLSEKTIQSFKR